MSSLSERLLRWTKRLKYHRMTHACFSCDALYSDDLARESCILSDGMMKKYHIQGLIRHTIECLRRRIFVWRFRYGPLWPSSNPQVPDPSPPAPRSCYKTKASSQSFKIRQTSAIKRELTISGTGPNRNLPKKRAFHDITESSGPNPRMISAKLHDVFSYLFLWWKRGRVCYWSGVGDRGVRQRIVLRGNWYSSVELSRKEGSGMKDPWILR